MKKMLVQFYQCDFCKKRHNTLKKNRELAAKHIVFKRKSQDVKTFILMSTEAKDGYGQDSECKD